MNLPEINNDQVIKSNPLLIKSGGCILYLLAPVLLILSCHVSRTLTTTHINTDSIVTHVRDSSAEVLQKVEAYYQQTIHGITSSGVTFDNDCPDLAAARATLDSIGRVNFDKALYADSVRRLVNKVSITNTGLITAEGRIKSAYFTNDKLTAQLSALSVLNDSLWRVHSSDSVRLSRKEATVTKTVVKTKWPWWIMILCCAVGFVVAWWGRGRV